VAQTIKRCTKAETESLCSMQPVNYHNAQPF